MGAAGESNSRRGGIPRLRLPLQSVKRREVGMPLFLKYGDVKGEVTEPAHRAGST